MVLGRKRFTTYLALGGPKIDGIGVHIHQNHTTMGYSSVHGALAFLMETAKINVHGFMVISRLGGQFYQLKMPRKHHGH